MHFEVITNNWPLIASGVVLTLEIASAAILLGLAEFRLRIAAVPAVMIALGINNAAYLSQIIRGGFQSVHKGQLEAAAALGLAPSVTFREIVLPQALRAVYPALGNQFIQTVLASSIGSVIGAPELTQQINFIDSRSFRTIELLAFLTVTYAVLTLVLSGLVRAFGRRLEHAYR